MESSKGKLHKWLIKAIWFFCGVILLGIATGAILLNRIYDLSGWNLNQSQPSAPNAPITDGAQTDKYISSLLVVVQNAPLSTENAFADMAFIVSFNALDQELTTAALLHGLELKPEDDRTVTVGELYASEGPAALLDAINTTFGLNIASYACTDTSSLAAMIDLLGGINAELTAEEAEYLNRALSDSELRAGEVVLTGTQSMVHAMDEISGEFAFGGLQRSLRLVDSAVLNMRRTATKETMLPLLAKVMGSINTDLDIETVRGFAYEILKAEEFSIHSLPVPCEGSFEWLEQGDARCLAVDLEANKAALRELIY